MLNAFIKFHLSELTPFVSQLFRTSLAHRLSLWIKKENGARNMFYKLAPLEFQIALFFAVGTMKTKLFVFTNLLS